ncbi:hypothetical protein CVT24_011531 [Panaeolus cyanescens]|uniref:DUF1764-domain-containing protein n=1 Tax=Panaeolus cyanescens TaxID=181874 RepID=A0A409VM74_9AGAR|nr:hypothetical protein CVT24_011531 [Panaeolus cyanescens]
MSEIDDIFASKGKVKQQVSQPDPPSQASKSKSKKKKSKSEKPKTAAEQPSTGKTPEPVPSQSKKRSLPETIVDSSSQIAAPPKRLKTKDAKKSKSSNSKSGPTDADFADSRGKSTRRQTEEGWLVYKEDELGIKDEGGDTPLCPFDCDCCF